MTYVPPQIALFGRLADGSPGQKIGRTALVKLCYLLQTLCGVPLPYRFTLYSYGPFDQSVLYDLGVAESLGLLEERAIAFQSGYGYEIRRTPALDQVAGEARSFLSEYAKQIDWVIATFAGATASDLELLSTIVYADREASEQGGHGVQTIGDLAATVAEIKPRFGRNHIESSAQVLANLDLLTSV